MMRSTRAPPAASCRLYQRRNTPSRLRLPVNGRVDLREGEKKGEKGRRSGEKNAPTALSISLQSVTRATIGSTRASGLSARMVGKRKGGRRESVKIGATSLRILEPLPINYGSNFVNPFSAPGSGCCQRGKEGGGERERGEKRA